MFGYLDKQRVKPLVINSQIDGGCMNDHFFDFGGVFMGKVESDSGTHGRST